MQQISFQERLQAAQQAGNLSVADLSLWFDRSYHTVRGWLVPRADRGRDYGYEPWDPHRNEILRRLTNLERFVSRRKMPYRLKPTQRRDFLKKHAHDYNSKVSTTHSST